MVWLLSRSQPGRFDLISGSATLPFASLCFPSFSSASTPRKINSLTEHPRSAALALRLR